MRFPTLSLSRTARTMNYGEHCIRPSFRAPAAVAGYEGQTYGINICSRCLTSHPTERSLRLHSLRCNTVPFPPIYGESDFKIAQVAEASTKQQIALLGRLFIKSKTVSYEICKYDVFIIYAEEVMGYFSRPKDQSYSLSCICVFPPFARRGLGSLLIDFSYLSCRAEGIARAQEIAGPERPFSKKAIYCFRKYWKYKVGGAETVRQASDASNISIDDAVVGLELNGFNFHNWGLEGDITVEKPRLLSGNQLIASNAKKSHYKA